MRVAIAGSSGAIGTLLLAALEARGDEVIRLVRPTTGLDGLEWDPSNGTIDAAGLDGVDVLVNLAGRSIGDRRWTDQEKQLLWDSRIDSTGLLARTIAEMAKPPALFVSASAIGFYGDRGDDPVTESDAAGGGFLAELSVAWERATAPAVEAGVPTALVRTGIVLSADGGALGRLLAPLGPRWISPYRWGIGGPVGRGRQWWSWISMSDQIRALLHVIDNQLVGPVNLTAPEAVTHRTFIKRLGAALRRPTVIPIPPFVVKLVLGSELAAALVLDGQRVRPTRLLESGFEFEHTEVDAALREALAS